MSFDPPRLDYASGSLSTSRREHTQFSEREHTLRVLSCLTLGQLSEKDSFGTDDDKDDDGNDGDKEKPLKLRRLRDLIS